MNNIKKWLGIIIQKLNRSNVEVKFDIEKPEDREGYIISLIDQIKVAKSEIKKIKPLYNEVISLVSDFQKFKQLPGKYKNKIIDIASKINRYKEERELYKSSLNIDPKYKHLEAYASKMPQILKTVKDLEHQHALIKNDFQHLEGEKAELKYQRKRLLNMQMVIRVISLIFFSLFTVFIGIFILLMTVYNKDVFIPSIILCLLALIFVLFLFIFNRQVLIKTSKNERLQRRVTELINKVKIKYVNNINFLEHEYYKLNINSYEELSYFWEQFNKQKKEKAQYYRATEQLADLEETLFKQLQNYEFDNVEQLIYKVDIFIDDSKFNETVDYINKDMDKLKEQMEYNKNVIRTVKHQLKLLSEHNESIRQEIEYKLRQSKISLKELDK
ncbi:MAG: hypothetical protein ACOCRK_03335 [bacterium]